MKFDVLKFVARLTNFKPIIGTDQYFPIEEEERAFDDILELDFPESHYSLPLKEFWKKNSKRL